jgi:hypothetical protein
MRRITITLLTLLALASIAVVAVWADSPHYKKAPSCVDNGLTATCTGTIAGLGNGDVQVKLDFPQATSTTICSSPGGNDSPGQNPAVPTPVSGTAFYPNPKNGSLSFTVMTTAPANPTPQQAGCPNSNWTARIDNVTFGAGTLTVRQDNDGNNTYETLVSSLTFNVNLP